MTSIDLFAGVGGIRLGFEQAFGKDLKTIFVSEWNSNAQITYKVNFKEENIYGDITKISEKDIPAFDICLAGFPCQAFSYAGQRKGFEDDYHGLCRGTLFLDVARICDYHKPKVIFCENVKGLVSHDKGRTFKVITKTFEDIGYKVFYQVLNSRNFGVAQNRERIYIVAFRKDIAPTTFNFPSGDNDKVRIKDILDTPEEANRYFISENYLKALKKHKQKNLDKHNGFGYVVRDFNDVFGTIVCGGMGREGNLLKDTRLGCISVNSENIRTATPREFFRAQGFPENFVLPLVKTHMYKQAGNTVTVPVIKAIAEEIKKVLNGA